MQLDLNLLAALDALLEEGSVGGAANRMHVTSPAMSRTLGRIRDATGDDILVRTGRHMTITPYAQSLREEVHALVAQAQALMAPRGALDLAGLQRTFTLQCHDAITSALAVPLLQRLQRQAPEVTLRWLPEAAVDTNDLRLGRIDLEIGAQAPTLADVQHEVLGEVPLVVAMRAKHPMAGQRLTVKRYAAAVHVTVSRRGRLRDPVDELLAQAWERRRVVASLPTSTLALQYVSQSDALVVVPDRACAAIITALKLRTTTLPFNLPRVPVVAAWHRRYERDPAHAWLREQVREAAAEQLTAGPAARSPP